jgi:RNA polymerase sigma-70 factor (ECF subfamily)
MEPKLRVRSLDHVTSTGTHPTDATSSDESMAPSPVWNDFESFYRSEHELLERALAMAIGDIEMGRDAAAEGFARALQRWRKVGRYANPSGWVYRVGLNWAYSRRRRIRRDTSDAVTSLVRADTELAVPGTLSGEVTAALLQLSLEHRAVVVARFVLDWSESQVAAALDIPPGTAKSRSSRALARLEELLEDHHD